MNVANANSEVIVKNVYAYQPPQAFHDEHKFNDIILALALAHGGPPSPEDNEIIYLHHTSLLAAYELWHRLKMSVDEEALNIVLMLRDTTSRHQGLEWEEIERLIEVNAPRKPLWYTLQQKEMLLKWVDRIREDEKKKAISKYPRRESRNTQSGRRVIFGETIQKEIRTSLLSEVCGI